MIQFNLKGISVEAEIEMTQQDYKDCGGHYRTRFDKEVRVIVRFWKFTINGNLTELAHIKSTLNYFMQAYWKRTSKEGNRIELAETLQHSKDTHTIDQQLILIARQKNKQHFLEITMLENRKAHGQIYLNGREVIMLDIAIAKAISLLSSDYRCTRGSFWDR